MNTGTGLIAVLASALLSFSTAGNAALTEVPVEFQGFDPNSTFTINYDDVSALLDTSVMNVGRSTRERTKPTQAMTGSRVTSKANALTGSEGNRFWFENFEDEEANRKILLDMKHSLEQVPSEVPLEFFSRSEQLAYWLNLYNVTLLSEVVDLYPKRSMKKYLVGKKSILDKEVLNVAGIPLSLNDIQFVILKENYDSSPIVLYGLYQGIIGGPNIRKRAYTGENVYRYLEQNAAEFVNSNRGSFSKNDKTFRVSSFYDRSRQYFPNFETELRAHLLNYLEGRELGQLQAASVIKPNINDWSITDLYGSATRAGGSLASNPAAMIGAVTNTVPTQDGGFSTTVSSINSAAIQMNTQPLSRFSPEVLIRMQELDEKRRNTAVEGATVTLEDFESEPPADEPEPDEQQEESPED